MTNITGIEEFKKILEKAGKLPAKFLTKATKSGANFIRNEAKAGAPKRTGLLQRSIKIKAEKRRTGKKVYQIKFVSDKLAKESASGKRSFYPTSQEYGWKLQDGSKVPGKFFMRNAVNHNRARVEQDIINDLAESLRGLR